MILQLCFHFMHIMCRVHKKYWMLDLSCDCIYAQVTGVQLESPKVFMGGKPAQGNPISVYYYGTKLEARWITGYMWSSLWCC